MFGRLIRSHALRRRVSWVIAAILLLPFILFFHATGQMPNGPGGAPGTVFGKPIPWQTYQEQYRQVSAQWKQQFGGDIPAGFESFLQQSVWDRILLMEEAKRERIRVTDDDVLAVIQKDPNFQEAGQFSRDRYYRLLALNSLTPSTYEASLRQQLMVQKLLESVKATVGVTDRDIKTAYTNDHERMHASLFLFDLTSYLQQTQARVTDQDIQTHYAAHPEEVRIPEQVTIEYAGVSRNELLAHADEPSEERLNAYYQEHQDEWKTEQDGTKPFEDVRALVRERVQTQQISKHLRALALDLQDDLEASLRFEEIVTARALAPQTIGPMEVNRLMAPGGPDPASLQTIAALPNGRISDVLETEEGTYIGRVLQRIPSRVPPLEDVRNRVRERVVEAGARAAAKTAAETFQTRLGEQLAKGLRFEEAMLALNGPMARPVEFTRTQPIDPIGSAPAANEAAFATPLGKLTGVLETPGGFVILRPETLVPADETGFADAKAGLQERLLNQKQAEHTEQWLTELRARAKLKSATESPSAAP